MLLLQIVTHAGDVVRFPAGGPLERDFIDACTKAIVAKGVGFFTTESQVADRIATGIAEAVYALKTDTRYISQR